MLDRAFVNVVVVVVAVVFGIIAFNVRGSHSSFAFDVFIMFRLVGFVWFLR